MNDTTTPDSTEDYLSALEKALGAVTPAVRATILEDIRGHIADALDSGQAVTAVLERLGSPDVMALSAVAELDVAVPTAVEATRADPSRRILLLTATAVAVLAAALLSHVLPQRSTTVELGDGATQTGAAFALVLLTLVPVIASGLPLLLPIRMRAGFTLIAAVAGSVMLGITLSTIGSLYLPLVFLLWAAVIVPWLNGRGDGRGIRIALQIAFAIAILVPPVLFGSNLIIHSFEATWVIWVGALLSLLLVGLFAGGVRAGYLAAASLGGAMMVFAVIDSGTLFNETWLAGGLYLTIGLSAFLTGKRR